MLIKHKDQYFSRRLTRWSCALQVVNDSLNPTWNQTFDIVVEDGLHDMLMLEVWDHDTFGKVPAPFLSFNLYQLNELILERSQLHSKPRDGLSFSSYCCFSSHSG